jgi:hypothetical protein
LFSFFSKPLILNEGLKVKPKKTQHNKKEAVEYGTGDNLDKPFPIGMSNPKIV